MKRAPLLLVLLTFVACNNPTTNSNNNNGKPGPTGPTGTNPQTTDPKAVCDGGASTCSKWLQACKKDCKVITDATKKDECTKGCDGALDECVDACKDASDPADFDAKAEDWDGKPEPPKATSEDCGGVGQACCTDDQFDECQEGLQKIAGTNPNTGAPICGCLQKCTKNLFDQANNGVDDCPDTEVCLAANDYQAKPGPNNPLVCLAGQCNPTEGSGNSHSVDPGCGYPYPRCTAGIGNGIKPEFGFCNEHCRPHSSLLTCSVTEVCYPTYTTVGQQILPVNLCGAKGGNVADGAACVFGITGTTGGFTATENCAANTYCDITQPAGPNRKCRKSCGIEGPTGSPAPSGSKCNGANQPTCNRFLGNLTGITGVQGATAGQLVAAAEEQGAFYMCKNK